MGSGGLWERETWCPGREKEREREKQERGEGGGAGNECSA